MLLARRAVARRDTRRAAQAASIFGLRPMRAHGSEAAGARRQHLDAGGHGRPLRGVVVPARADEPLELLVAGGQVERRARLGVHECGCAVVGVVTMIYVEWLRLWLWCLFTCVRPCVFIPATF